MHIHTFLIAAALTALLGVPSALAAESTAPAPQPTVQQIVEQQVQLRADVVAKKGAFKDLTETERQALVKTQTRILTLLENQNAIEQLRAEEKVELFNHLQWVSATVRQAEEDRQVCERTRTVGSNRFQVVCMTARQYREHKEGAQRSMRTIGKCQGATREALVCKSETD